MPAPRSFTRAEAEAVENLLDALNDFSCDGGLRSRAKSPLTQGDRKAVDAACYNLTDLLMRIRDRYCPRGNGVPR
jgi:hypothetical protein